MQKLHGGVNIAMRGRFRWQGLVAAAVLVLASVACDEEGEFVSEPEEDDIGAVCSMHSDCLYACIQSVQHAPPHCTRSCAGQPCPAGYYCVSREGMGQVCATGYCSSDADCPANYVCRTNHHVCQHDDIPCGSDADCPAATACNQGLCATDCASNDDCKQGFQCQSDLGCVQCLDNADCSNDFACIGGGCNTSCVESSDCRYGYYCEYGGCLLIQGGGPGQVGDPCQAGQHDECQYFCHHDSRCNQPCNGPNDPPCPDGWSCHEDHMYCRENTG